MHLLENIFNLISLSLEIHICDYALFLTASKNEEFMTTDLFEQQTFHFMISG